MTSHVIYMDGEVVRTTHDDVDILDPDEFVEILERCGGPQWLIDRVNSPEYRLDSQRATA